MLFSIYYYCLIIITIKLLRNLKKKYNKILKFKLPTPCHLKNLYQGGGQEGERGFGCQCCSQLDC